MNEIIKRESKNFLIFLGVSIMIHSLKKATSTFKLLCGNPCAYSPISPLVAYQITTKY